MSLDKAILHNKEHRRQYYLPKSVDPSCRNHGSCPWCQGNRMYKHKKKYLRMKQKEDDYLKEKGE